jgi:hypothetical protein
MTAFSERAIKMTRVGATLEEEAAAPPERPAHPGGAKKDS